MKKLKLLFKREPVFMIAILLAIITSFISFPKLEYINFKVLILLFNLMIIVAAFTELKVLDYIASSILIRCKTYKTLALALIFITFFTSMLVTNDVALITFVPLTLLIGKKSNMNMLKIVVFETLAANLGSALTPMGNPQNLFIYSFYNIKPWEFFKITLPLTILSAIFLILIIIKEKDKGLNFKLNIKKPTEKIKIAVFTILMIIILLSVFNVFDYKVTLIITILVVLVMDKRLFIKIDYYLLLTFIGFFIFVGNISNMNIVKEFMENILNSNTSTYISGLLCSQVISNVPATMLLSPFTTYYKELLLAVNIGGLGTLIASLASLISYKYYAKENRGETVNYLKVFTEYNLIGLLVLGVLFYCLT
ncbi:MAG: anion transporter [Clostridiales bacterium]|nr:anion transporter [Clostridiales bacterium]